MNDISKEEMELILIARDLRPFETIELKLNESGDIIYTWKRQERYMLTKKTF